MICCLLTLIRYTSKMLLAAIDESHGGTYDFLYLPIDFKVCRLFLFIIIIFYFMVLVSLISQSKPQLIEYASFFFSE